MRDAYHGDLRQLSVELSRMCGRATEAMTKASKALLGPDVGLAEEVIADDLELGRLHAAFEQAACSLLALQAPVAGELRAVVSMIEVAEKVRRMGGLACHVAEAVRRRHPSPVVPEPLARRFAEMGQIGVFMSRRVRAAVEFPSTVDVDELERLDDRVDEVEAVILAWVNDQESDVQAGVDVALLARYFKRYADQGVGAARKLHFVATGERVRADRKVG